ncbi:MAG: carbamoyl phosphate synthase large subunit [Thermoproteota archaeon]|nr:MAG: carbamoyl phosphate synthase large subunit [Candidatus Korarchaeota archaeon]
MPKFSWLSKALVLGSGGIKIGEAGEFDYSGSQALKALSEEGIEAVLVNPNIATIQTDPTMADKVYLVPVTPEHVAKVIERERPQGILLGFGGQTALNCGVALAKSGVLEEHGVRVLGSSVEAIERTEDRELFRRTMEDAGIPVPRSRKAFTVEDALEAADELGYPVVVKAQYMLGGGGSGVAWSRGELREVARRALAKSASIQVEEYLGGWKEVEYEVVRDYAGNCVTVCNMENVDPMGVHTGDSIVVAPSQTLTDREYHMLRQASLRVAEAVGVVGECNVQFALHPEGEEYRVIEVNARMSRSSALASKATGYPLAYVAAKLAIGYTLPELKNKVTGVTTAAFEPALDYVVVKVPRWDFEKFPGAARELGTGMKSIGEVMAIGRCFEEALQKAFRMLDKGYPGVACVKLSGRPLAEVLESIRTPKDNRILEIAEALKLGASIGEVAEASKIDKFYISKVENIVRLEERLRKEGLKPSLLREAKRLGFSDRQIAMCTGLPESEVRELRKRLGVKPCVKQIDTLAAEWPAQTNYLYVTYGGVESDIEESKRRKIMVLGSGCYRVGSSVEFDWCCVNAVRELRARGFEVIVVNCNPETVSTDYDVSDRLYFEELTLERVLDIYEAESPEGVVVSFGGQTANNLAVPLHEAGVKLVGSSAESIDMAEDREKFSSLLDSLGIPQPEWASASSIREALEFAEGKYPVIVRPSYVLSGQAMRVAYSRSELERYLKQAAEVSEEHPVVVSRFIMGAREAEVDAVSDGSSAYIGAVIEHIENAGVHSGDSTMVIPPCSLPEWAVSRMREYTLKIARALDARGPLNIQFLVKDEVYVIECNLRASRSMPYVSKATGVNLVKLAVDVLLGGSLGFSGVKGPPEMRYYAVKVPQFSFRQLPGVDPLLGVEMMSTGEVCCLGESMHEAYVKALKASGIDLKGSSVLITVGGLELKSKVLPVARVLHECGFKILSTEHTAQALRSAGVPAETIYKISEPDRHPNIADLLARDSIALVINIPWSTTLEKYSHMLEDGREIRRKAAELGIPVVTTLEQAKAIAEAVKASDGLKLAELREYWRLRGGSCIKSGLYTVDSRLS